MKLIWLLLVPGPQPTEASNCLFDRVEEVVKHESRPAIHMEKQLGWAHKLGGVESLGIFSVGQTVLARLIESQIRHQPVGSMALMGEGSEKGQWHL